MRLGILGGTYDPVHVGHLILAECCRDALRLDAVWFVLAPAPPHKAAEQLTPVEQREEMLRLAIGGHEPFEVSRIEIDRGGLSYTVDTLRQLHAERPDDELFLLLGADSLIDLPRWREPAEICRLAMPVVVSRPGAGAVDFDPLAPFVVGDRLELFKQHVVATPEIGVSSSDLRRRVAAGRSIRFQTPRAVEQYIAANGLYRDERR